MLKLEANMKKFRWLIPTLAVASAAVTAVVAQGQPAVFLSTQFTPVEEAQRMKQVVLKNFSSPVEYLPQATGPFTDRVIAEFRAGKVNTTLLGGLHGDYPALQVAGALEPVDDVLASLKGRKFPKDYLKLGKLGTDKQMYIPWMQATYLMVANKQALQYLPVGTDLNKLTYDQLADWGENITKATGQKKIGIPAGPTSLIHRFLQGYLYPSFTGSTVTRFRGGTAIKMWQSFKDIWKNVNPQATAYNFMQEQLLSGEVWVAWDHIARLKDALNQKPNDFVAFPSPVGPNGRGFMPVLAGVAIPKGSENKAQAAALIEYLTRPEVQVETLIQNGFFPVVDVKLPTNLPVGLKLAADAIKRQATSPVSTTTLLPVGLGAKGGEFNKVYIDTFTRIVLRGEDIKTALDTESANLRKIINDTKASCWAPDPVSNGPCPVN
jgi:multiple sugar transport system substrate-binding protein